MEKVVLSLATSTDKDLFEINVCYVGEDKYGNYRAIYEDNGLGILRVPQLSKKRSSLLYPAGFVRSVMRYKPSIVHIHSGVWYKASLAARLCGLKRIIYTEHGRMIPDSLSTIFLDNLASLLTGNIITVSEDLRSYKIILISYLPQIPELEYALFCIRLLFMDAPLFMSLLEKSAYLLNLLTIELVA